MNNYLLARRLALSILHGSWQQPELVDRLQRALDHFPAQYPQLAARLLFRFERPPLSIRPLAVALLDEPLLERYWQHATNGLRNNILLDAPVMGLPRKSLVTFPLPQLATAKDLAEWLTLLPWELRVMADCKGDQAHSTETRKHHYRYRWVEKRSGGLRLIEIPKSTLKLTQRHILKHIINRVPPHDCAHGFTRGRSCLSHVQAHINRPVVLQMDLRDFFHSVSVNRVFGLFSTLGYPAGVARLLAGLCTHSAAPDLAGPAFAALNWEQRKFLQAKHLPQGAPTSGALANLCAYRFDCRLQGLATRYGLHYTRYADDIAFSGPGNLRHRAEWIESLAGAIALEEGFQLNFRKTRVQTQAQRQRVTGIVVNSKANLPRGEYDNLKAILHNCRRHGAASQNREKREHFREHLAGRIAQFKWINEAKGARLDAMFRAIDWSS
jgi:retron-type reverse transcriptase